MRRKRVYEFRCGNLVLLQSALTSPNCSHEVPVILTQRGLDLYPVVTSIVHWATRTWWTSAALLHEHKNCGKLFDPVMIRSECGEPLEAKQVHIHPGPGAAKVIQASG